LQEEVYFSASACRHMPGRSLFRRIRSLLFFLHWSVSFSVWFRWVDKFRSLLFNNGADRAVDFRSSQKPAVWQDSHLLSNKEVSLRSEDSAIILPNYVIIAHPILILISFSRIFGGRWLYKEMNWPGMVSHRQLSLSGPRYCLKRALSLAIKCLATARGKNPHQVALDRLSERYGYQSSSFAMDVTDEAAAAHAVMAAVDVFGSLDVVINNACMAIFRPFEDHPPIGIPAREAKRTFERLLYEGSS